MELLAQIIEILVGGITGIASGIGTGLTNLVQAIFVTVGAEGTMELTTFGVVIVVFAGVSLAISLSKFITGWVTSLGARD